MVMILFPFYFLRSGVSVPVYTVLTVVPRITPHGLTDERIDASLGHAGLET